ncbi:MAG: zf-HC2 domain-containing protein [Verrucomicrobia bacterium]|nr:zf-HC2 domain-containing protein [Verrucomicrobiota bacterium]MBV8484189.1 zf-HC2 domain-containing protein [Verrucomicrobiota bacterium]
MAHLTEQLRRGFLARSLSPTESIAAIEHLRSCDLCRNDLIALRANERDSVDDQILPVSPGEQHPSDDLLAAYVDNDLEPLQEAHVKDHLRLCHLCAEIIADLANFKTELERLPAKKYAPDVERRGEQSQRKQLGSQEMWGRAVAWLNKPLALGGAFAVALVIIAGLVATRLFFQSAVPGQLTVDTIQDGSLTFSVPANGQLKPLSGMLPDDAANVIAMSILVLTRSQMSSQDLMRGPSETSGVRESTSPEETKLPGGEYFFSRRIFGAVVALPRATSDPDVQPNGIVIRETIPVLSWSAESNGSTSQHLTVRDCATNQTIVEAQVSGGKHSFAIPSALQHGGFYVWELSEDIEGNRTGKSVSGRFKVISEIDLKSLTSPAAHSSHLLKSFLLARAGLFAEADAELTKLGQSNPKSPTIISALNYIRELEGM